MHDMRFIQLHLRNQVDLQHHDKIAKTLNYKVSFMFKT